MKLAGILGAAAALVLVVGLTACAPAVTPVTTPVVKDVGALQGATVDLRVGQMLDINTGSLAVDSYTGVVADPAVAEFMKGRVDGGTTFNPGVTARAVGTTQVVLSNANGGIQNVTFTVAVTAP